MAILHCRFSNCALSRGRARRADSCRYFAETLVGETGATWGRHSHAGYDSAQELAEAELGATDLFALRNSLHYTMYLFEYTNDPDGACRLAAAAYQAASGEQAPQ